MPLVAISCHRGEGKGGDVAAKTTRQVHRWPTVARSDVGWSQAVHVRRYRMASLCLSAPDLRGFTLGCVLYTVHIEWSCIKLFVLLDTLSYVRTVSIQSGARESSSVLVSKLVRVLLVIREEKCVLHLNSCFVGINPSAWGHLNPSSYCDVGRLFYGVFKLWSKLQRKKWRNNF